MFIRSFLLAILAASLLGLSSACLTPSQVQSMFNKNTNKMKKKWAKAKNARTCDAAIKAAMRYSLAPLSGDNVGAWVQMVSELGQGLKEADGNLKKMYKTYTRNCSTDWDKGLKKLGYPSIIGSAWEKCIDKNRSVDQYQMSTKELVDIWYQRPVVLGWDDRHV